MGVILAVGPVVPKGAIKVIKRTAFGYRNLAYFFLRIKAALPGKYAVPMFTQLEGKAVIGDQLWQGAWTGVL